MFLDQTTPDLALRGVILAIFALLWVVILIRINGLRSLSKMTNFDFVMTIALGSLVASASQSSQWTGFIQSLLAMAALFAAQFSAAKLRRASQSFDNASQNTPVLLMRDGRLLDDALVQTRVSRSDVIAKLREANVLAMEDVRAVVLETTGDVSVLHGDRLEDELLEGVEKV